MKKERSFQKDKSRSRPGRKERQAPRQSAEHSARQSTPLSSLHHTVGNRGVQRLLAQRDGAGATELDAETADRIDRARNSGQSLDASTQSQMGDALGYDMSDVRVHTSSEADTLSRRLGAKAFTTGQDVFFREGAYDPSSTSGQELIAHELTHVVQQGTGAVGDGGALRVNAPGDAHEVQADATAKGLTGASSPAQRQEIPEEEETLQMQEEEEIQMQEEEEIQMQEEEEIQMQEEEEEEVQP